MAEQVEKVSEEGKGTAAGRWKGRGLLLSLLILLEIILLPMFGMAWIVGCIVIGMGNVHPGWQMLNWTVFIPSLFLLQLGLIFRWRILWRVCGILTLISAAAFGSIEFHRWWTVDRHKQLSDRIDWFRYAPFRENSKVVKVTADPSFHIRRDLPRIDGAYALFPLYAGVVQALYPPRDYALEILNTNGSDVTFQRLLNGKVDLIFSAPPSADQQEAARKKGLTYEITPFAKEAFVFFVNAQSPVRNLTQGQIRDIYAGKVTNWKQLGYPFDAPIKPFQRNRGSGSQTMLEKIMGSTPIMPPLKEDRVSGMGGIINDVANYRNYREAIGFTFRYFSTEMFRRGEIRLLSIDGVEPTRENIRNGRYPFIGDCCVITVRPRSEGVRKIVDFLRSPAGRELIEKTGYTPLPE
ncbi:MAG: substrate-binding domain-containing protein [Lentisphaeria bacterium]|nr:substrate-binding domain-containing protein [Lentisphaeria bacterium]